jgi:7,8-dihydropterin-6-yl-methyl-4-(beta-D-ribofuranosyl)aminobenzene 5'-phosphate synthase
MPLTVHILADNRALPGFSPQWGFCCLLETLETTWLMDTGADGCFLEHAANKGLSPQGADGLFLSHAHYDHTRGIPALLEAGFAGCIVGHPHVFRSTVTPKTSDAGPPLMETDLPEGMFIRVDEQQIFPGGLTFVTNIKRRPGNYQSVTGFSLDAEGNIPDTLPDDAFVVYESVRGPVLLFGCCHSGVANSLACLRERLGIDQVYSVLGGLHLFNAPLDALEQTARALDEFGVQEIHAGHCTGDDAAIRLATMCRGKITPLAAGMSLTFS